MEPASTRSCFLNTVENGVAILIDSEIKAEVIAFAPPISWIVAEVLTSWILGFRLDLSVSDWIFNNVKPHHLMPPLM
jgi:hypothetical protein